MTRYSDVLRLLPQLYRKVIAAEATLRLEGLIAQLRHLHTSVASVYTCPLVKHTQHVLCFLRTNLAVVHQALVLAGVWALLMAAASARK